MRKLRPVWSLMFICFSAVDAHSRVCRDVFSDVQVELRQIERSSSVNALIRGNPGHFFASQIYRNWSKNSSFVQHVGPIYGDGHTSNLHVDFVNGRARWMTIDRDDMGVGPLIAGIAKTIILAKSASSEVKTRKMIDAYMDGLGGVKRTPPREVGELLEISYENYIEGLVKYAERQSDGNALKIREDYSPLPSAQIRSLKELVESAFPKTQFLDAALMTKERGGSADAVRYRILASVSGYKLILDMKEVLETALVHVGETKDRKLYMESLLERTYEGDLDYRKVVEYDDKVFSLIIKIEADALVNQPPKKREVDDFVELNLFNANAQGLDAQSSPGARGLLAEYRRDPEMVVGEIKGLVEEYIEYVSGKWDEAQ